MTRNERKFMVAAMNGLHNMSLNGAIESMWQRGLLNKRAIEQFYIREEVSRRVRAGEVKVRAIKQISEELNCSFEKVRAAVYH